MRETVSDQTNGELAQASGGREPAPGAAPGGSREALMPYLIVLVVGAVIAAGVLAYVALYRDEILAILTQSPT
jgi:hypothetical protein